MKKIQYIILLFFGFISVHAKECIDLLSVDAYIDTSGTMFIHEKITVFSEGNIVKNGIYRDLKQSYFWNNVIYNFFKNNPTIYFVKCNDQDVYYHFKENRIKIGSSFLLLPTGTHTYEIGYSLPANIKYYTNYDRIYWHVTGRNWNLPINRIIVSIYIESNNSLFCKKLDAFIQQSWHTIKKRLTYEKSNDSFNFTSNDLSQGEELIIDVTFDKGFFIEKTFDDIIKNKDFRAILYVLICFLIFYSLRLKTRGNPKNYLSKKKYTKWFNTYNPKSNSAKRSYNWPLLYEYMLFIVLIPSALSIGKYYQILTLEAVINSSIFIYFTLMISFIKLTRFGVSLISSLLLFSIYLIKTSFLNIIFAAPIWYLIYKILCTDFFEKHPNRFVRIFFYKRVYIHYIHYRRHYGDGGGGGGGW